MPVPSLRRRIAAVLGLASLAIAAATVHAADVGLATSALGKAAVACQKTIAQATAKAETAKGKALDACANGALACVQTKADATDCRTKAGQTCAKQLAGAAAAFGKAQARIVGAKSCASLRLADLLSDDGLGLGSVAGGCLAEHGLDVCTGLDAVAACLLRTRDRAAGARYGEARPRTGELLALLPTALPAIDGLPTSAGCGACGTDAPARKAVERCAKTLTKAAGALVAALEKPLAACAQKVLACVQTKAAASACLTKATAGCDKSGAKLASAAGKLAAAVAKHCGPAAVDFAALAAPSGLNLAASTACPAPASTDGLSACLQARIQCTTAAVVRRTIARSTDFADRGHLGALGAPLAAACDADGAPVAVGAPHGSRAFFGSIVKFLKQVRRPGVLGVRKTGAAPGSSPGAKRTVRVLGGPSRFAKGGLTKIPFRYATGRARAGGPRAVDPPALLVTVVREDVALEDHFEVPLEEDPATAELDDEIEVTYADDDLPACAFTLALATRIDGVVSAYTPVLQVLDAEQPGATPVPTPTATPLPPGITTIIDAAGDGSHSLNAPSAIAVDGMGNVFVAGLFGNVFKITPGGVVTRIIDDSGDGLGNTLSFVQGIAVDDAGNAYVTGSSTSNAFKIEPGGAITQIIDASGDGGGNTLSLPRGIAVDAAQNVYVLGGGSNNAFKIEPGGTITEIIDASGDGMGHAFGAGERIAVDGDGNVYVVGDVNAFKITPGGTITQIIDATGDGMGHPLLNPIGIAVDGDGNVFVTGFDSDNVFEIAPGGGITEIIDASGDGVGNGLNGPSGITVDADGVVYVTGENGDNAFAITPGGTITRIIDASGDGDGNVLDGPIDIAVDGSGNVYVAGFTSDNAFRITP